MFNKDLRNYWPEYLQYMTEFDEIGKAENPEFEMVGQQTTKLRNNQYIQSCDEDGIKRFEDMLEIQALPDETLGARINRVLVRWNENEPYTYRVLLRRLDMLCGAGNYEIDLRHNDYVLCLTTHLSAKGEMRELERLLDYFLPCNIQVVADNKLETETEGQLYMAAPLTYTAVIGISGSIYSYMEGKLFAGGVPVITKIIDIE